MKGLLGGHRQPGGWLLLSHGTCQSCIQWPAKLCRSLPGRGRWACKAGLALTALHGGGEGVSEGWDGGAVGCQGHRVGLLGRVPGLWDKAGRPWARACPWGRAGKAPSGGDPAMGV